MKFSLMFKNLIILSALTTLFAGSCKSNSALNKNESVKYTKLSENDWLVELYDSAGFKKSECHKDGKKNVSKYFKTYYPSGKIESEVPVVDGKQNGKSTYWYENGAVMSISNYENDELEGDHYFYDADGQLSIHKLFRHGVVVKKFEVDQFKNFDSTKEKKEWLNGFIKLGMDSLTAASMVEENMKGYYQTIGQKK